MTDLREQYARIIDPKAWVPVIFSGDPDWHPDDQRLEQNRSLAKADAILALLPQPAVPEGFVLVPREPDEDLIRAMNDGYRSVRRQGASGMSIDAQWRAEYGPEIAAYRALLAASPSPPDHIGEANEMVPSPPAETWRPIETAPRDGTRVDLFGRSAGLTAGPWRITDCWFSIGKWWRDDFEHGDDQSRSQVHRPTHWMPLPTPPKDEDR